MGLFAAIRREYIFITAMRATLARLKHIDPESDFLLPDEMELAVDRFYDNTAFTEGERHWTFGEFDACANRVANWAVAQGYQAGDTIALFSQNRLDYVAIWYGLSKVGVITALLNTALVGNSLEHCITVSGARAVISDEHLLDAVRAVKAQSGATWPLWCAGAAPQGVLSLDEALQDTPSERPDRSRRAGFLAGDVVLKMFTSGTTGLPKAALVTHARAQRYMNTFSGAVRAGPKDRMLMVLPLYHATGGLCGVGTALLTGGTVVVERRFSATRFWDEAVRSGATMFMYVGELCRFLVNTPETPAEHRHKIRAMIGNGLRPDVWVRFRERFRIRKIVEFYGATEGNVGLMNVDGQVGAIGRIPWYARKYFNVELIRLDPETFEPLRGPDGFCQRTAVNEPGEALGRIDPHDSRYRFDGYGSRDETQKKLLRDVFEKGDVYFRTGDLMRRDRHGYYYFVDRVGDTFRWMAENVSTNEVAEAFAAFPGISQVNVYGVAVPGYDGRAGMAAYVAQGEIDFHKLYAYLADSLPAFAIPVFLRQQKAAQTTDTFKFRKVELVKEGFDPDVISDPLYVLDRAAQTYLPLTRTLYRQILSGKFRL